MGKVSQEVRERYNNKKYHKITFRTVKEELPKEAIQDAADVAGLSLNAYIVEAIEAKMTADSPK